MGNRIITIKGGLGNQLFQYAHGLKLLLIDKKNVIFDTSFFANTGKDTNRPFLLNKFNIQTSASFKEIKVPTITKYWKKIIHNLTGNFELFQNEKYFVNIEKEIRQQFTLKNPLSSDAQMIVNQIHTHYPQSVSLHIRRGDYIQNPITFKHHGICDLDYYQSAIDYIKTYIETPFFFIFSDDITWAKENLKIENDALYVSNPSIPDYEELILMSTCQHNIIANSTFSWWAAYLNQYDKKIIIAPKQWTREKSSNQLDILPRKWIQL